MQWHAASPGECHCVGQFLSFALPAVHFGQKNNNQLAKGAAKAGGGRKESADNHTATATGDNRSMQWMTEQGGGR